MAKRGRPFKVEDPENNAWCSSCQSEKPKTEFYKNSSRSNGLDSRCKACNHKNKRERHEKDANTFTYVMEMSPRYREIFPPPSHWHLGRYVSIGYLYRTDDDSDD